MQSKINEYAKRQCGKYVVENHCIMMNIKTNTTIFVQKYVS